MTSYYAPAYECQTSSRDLWITRSTDPVVFYCVVRGVFAGMPMDFLKSSKLSIVAMTTNGLLIGKCHSYVGWYSYRPQRSCDKVMFSQASVILFTGGGNVCGRERGWGRVWQGVGGHVWQGGMDDRGCVWQGGGA